MHCPARRHPAGECDTLGLSFCNVPPFVRVIRYMKRYARPAGAGLGGRTERSDNAGLTKKLFGQ